MGTLTLSMKAWVYLVVDDSQPIKPDQVGPWYGCVCWESVLDPQPQKIGASKGDVLLNLRPLSALYRSPAHLMFGNPHGTRLILGLIGSAVEDGVGKRLAALSSLQELPQWKDRKIAPLGTGLSTAAGMTTLPCLERPSPLRPPCLPRGQDLSKLRAGILAVLVLLCHCEATLPVRSTRG